jgi:hypothetical protein
MNKIILLLLLSLFFFSCQQQEEKKANSKFNLQADVQNIVQGAEGSILIIPANSFVYEDGTAIKETVTLELTEAYDLKSILRNGLDTRTSNELLVTGGMINLKATTASNKEVVVAGDKEITLQVAESLSDSNNYQFFSQKEGVWTDPEKPSPYLTYLPIEKHSETYVYLKTVEEGEYDSYYQCKYTSEKKNIDGYKLYEITSFFLLYKAEMFNYLLKKLNLVEKYDLIDNSFLASKEYNDRFMAVPIFAAEQNYSIHKIYLENLDQPLWGADSLVLEELRRNLENARTVEDYENSEYYQELLKKISIFTKFKNQYKTIFPPKRFGEEDLEKLKKHYSKLKANEFIQSYRIMNLGWYNLDLFYKNQLFPTELKIECTEQVDRVAVLFKDAKVVLQASRKGNGQYCLNRDQTCGVQLPKGKAYAVAMTENDGVLLFAYKEITLGKDIKVTLDLQRSSEAEVTQIMERIYK